LKLKKEVGSALIANYEATGEVEKSASVISALLEAQPADPSLLFSAYQLYSQLADKTMLSLALAAPGSPQMHQVMARELARHGDDEMAITNYREALKLDPHLAGVHFELGNVLYNSDDEKHKVEAEEEFKEAIADNPQDEKALLMLGVIAAKRGDWHTAVEYDRRALTLQPDDSDANMELAKAFIATNERDQARKLIERAIAIDPTDYIAHYRLSSLYRQQGRQSDAEKQLAEYRKYKGMKDKLQSIFHDMRVSSGTGAQPDDDAQK
jgi:Tfp pilus assembly protein PilF